MKRNIERFKNHCCGCGLCQNICPKSAISMKKNVQGFLYPAVDQSKCVECGLCVKSCVFQDTGSPGRNGINKPLAVAFKHQNAAVREQSQSGGAFTAISDLVLHNGGVVYGCELVDFCTAFHTRAENREERNRQRGSKYIQSDLFGIYAAIQADLQSGKQVLFSGTPCQVAAVKSFFQNADTSNLLLVDLLCNGVGSPGLWAAYLESIGKQHGGKITGVVFRNKTDFGWSRHVETVFFEDGKQDSTVFKTLYNSHIAMRRDCASCIYKTVDRQGDISIGDCWGVKTELPDFYDESGVSLVLVNTEKGAKILRSLTGVDLVSVENVKLLNQPSLNQNWKLPQKYDAFWHFYEKNGFEKSMQKYNAYIDSILYGEEKPTMIRRLYSKCASIAKKVLKK